MTPKEIYVCPKKKKFNVVSAAFLLAISFANFLSSQDALWLLLCCLLSILKKDYMSHGTCLQAVNPVLNPLTWIISKVIVE